MGKLSLTTTLAFSRENANQKLLPDWRQHMTTAYSVIIHFAILLSSLCILFFHNSSTAQQVKEISLEISFVVAVSCTVR